MNGPRRHFTQINLPNDNDPHKNRKPREEIIEELKELYRHSSTDFNEPYNKNRKRSYDHIALAAVLLAVFYFRPYLSLSLSFYDLIKKIEREEADTAEVEEACQRQQPLGGYCFVMVNNRRYKTPTCFPAHWMTQLDP